VPTRTFELPDGRPCRVTHIEPAQALAQRRRGGDRRQRARVGPGVAARAIAPPYVERRDRPERRVCVGPRRTGLPGAWEDGWLLFEADARPSAASGRPDRRAAAEEKAGERRRLVPVPSGWDTCSPAELAEAWRRASAVRAAGAPLGGAPAGPGAPGWRG
jgi:hypothetical protein